MAAGYGGNASTIQQRRGGSRYYSLFYRVSTEMPATGVYRSPDTSTLKMQYLGCLPSDFSWRCFPYNKPVYTEVTREVVCRGKKTHIREGYKSFPSGHTFWSFAGLGYLSRLLRINLVQALLLLFLLGRRVVAVILKVDLRQPLGLLLHGDEAHCVLVQTLWD